MGRTSISLRMPYAYLRRLYPVDSGAVKPMPDDDLPPGLPASLLGAWGKTEPAARGPRRALTLEATAPPGVAVADRGGLAAVSMKRVADELGSKPMSLYRYVAAKDELLALMI